MTDFAPLGTLRPWVMAMRWSELAFLHWRAPASTLEPLIPSGLELQSFDGSAWLGVVPFLMSKVRARGVPPIPGTDRFLELNLRTYVSDGQRSGVWFFSLDAENPLAVRGARFGFHLPYMDARMSCTQSDATLEFQSVRTHLAEPPARFKARYAPSGEAFQSRVGSLEHWLTERYCLYSADRQGRVYRAEIEHPRWNLKAASVEMTHNTMAGPLGVTLDSIPDLAHYAAPLEVVAWWPTQVR